MILRPLIVLASLLSIVFAGFWPAFVERAGLSIRQVIGQDDSLSTTPGNAAQQQTTPETAATAANPQTQAAGNAAADTETTPPAAAAAPTVATTPAAVNPATQTTARTTARTTTPPAAAAAAAPAAAPAAAQPAADPASFEIPFTEQTGTMRYAPMPRKPGTKISVKNYTPLYPTSDYVLFKSAQKAGSIVATVTGPNTYASVVSSEAKNIPGASPPADAAMQKFLNRWKD